MSGNATYAIKVGSTTLAGSAGQGTERGQSTSISVKGEEPFAVAVGGGVGK
jgi:subtilase family serine protease